jgi:hypothetical protein
MTTHDKGVKLQWFLPRCGKWRGGEEEEQRENPLRDFGGEPRDDESEAEFIVEFVGEFF